MATAAGTPSRSLPSSATSLLARADLRAAADGAPDVGRGERGRVVDAVADHHDAASRAAELVQRVELRRGVEAASGVVDRELAGDGARPPARVAAEDGRREAHGRGAVPTAWRRLGAQRGGDGDDAAARAVARDDDHRVAAGSAEAIDAGRRGPRRPRRRAGTDPDTVRRRRCPSTPTPGSDPDVGAAVAGRGAAAQDGEGDRVVAVGLHGRRRSASTRLDGRARRPARPRSPRRSARSACRSCRRRPCRRAPAARARRRCG